MTQPGTICCRGQNKYQYYGLTFLAEALLYYPVFQICKLVSVFLDSYAGIYVYVNIYIHIYIYIYTCICISICIHGTMYTYIYLYTCMYILIFI